MGRGNNPYIQPLSPTRRADAYLALLVCAGIAFAARQFAAPIPTLDPQQAGFAINPIANATGAVKPSTDVATEGATSAPADLDPIYKELLNSLRLFDPPRRIDHPIALAVLRPLRGVHSAVWTDNSTLRLMVDGVRNRKAEIVEQVCGALEILGDTRAVVITLQDIDATERAVTGPVAWNCRLIEKPTVLARGMPQMDGIETEKGSEVNAR